MELTNEEKSLIKAHNKSLSTTSIDGVVGESAFRLWMLGKSLSEITNVFKGTEKEFSLSTLKAYKEHNNWEDRKKEIFLDLNKSNDDEIKEANRKKLSVLHIIFDVLDQEMAKDYQKYMEDPINTPKPFWFPKSMKDLDLLVRMHEFTIAGGVERSSVDVNNSFLTPKISKKGISQILKVLSDEATQEVIQGSRHVSSEEVLDADFKVIEDKS